MATTWGTCPHPWCATLLQRHLSPGQPFQVPVHGMTLDVFDLMDRLRAPPWNFTLYLYEDQWLHVAKHTHTHVDVLRAFECT